jgi:undecaprenyl-diphosphatase
VRLHLGCLLGGLVALVLVGWGVGALWSSLVGSSEVGIVRDLAADRSPQLTVVAKAVTWLGSAFVLVPLALAWCLLLLRAGARREAAFVALSLGGAMLISWSIKLLVSRPRPPVEHLQHVMGWSFPSGHATQASAFWVSLALTLPAAGAPPALVRPAVALAALIALAVAWSRVYLGVHYPSDVAAGLLLGAGWALFLARCVRARSPARPPAPPGPLSPAPGPAVETR